MNKIIKSMALLFVTALLVSAAVITAYAADTDDESDGAIYVDGEAYTGYYLDSDELMYMVTDGYGELLSDIVSSGTDYYSRNDEQKLTLAKNTVYINGASQSVKYYLGTDGNLYYVADGNLVCGTVSANLDYYDCADKNIKTISAQTVYVNGKVYTGYYTCSAGVMYKVTKGTRAKKTGTVSAGTKYYSYNSGKTLTLSKETVYVNGNVYTGYYTCSAGVMYKVTSGTRIKKTGTVAKGTKYYSYNSGKTLTLSKETVYVSGKAYTGYYTCSAGIMYKVTSGTRVKKSGTVAKGTKYYSYNSGKTLTVSKETVYVSGKVYTGYYTCSANTMYKVNNGTRAVVNGTLASGTKYYSYNDGKTMTLSTATKVVNGKFKDVWIQVSGTWRYYNSSGKQAFKSNTLHTAWTKIKSTASDTSYFIVVDTTNTKTMIFKGSKGNWAPVYEWSCSPGKSSTPTIKGTFTVKSKGYSFGTSSYTCYYYTQFYGNYLFHSILYDAGTFNVKDGRLGQQLSHGCVRLSLANAKWIYDNIPKGTKVYVY